MVIAAGYPNEMRHFIASNPGLGSRFSKTIEFPRYAPADLAAILRLMAKRQRDELPAALETSLIPWIEAQTRREDWGNAREMRNLLEKARECQSLRVASDASADLTKIELVDFEHAGLPIVGVRTGPGGAPAAPAYSAGRRLSVVSSEPLTRTIDQALDDPEVKKRLAELGGSLPATDMRSPAKFAAFVKAEIARWSPILKAADTGAK